MDVNTPALIISYLKYSESSAIVRFFTREKGFVAVMWKGVFNSKNKSKHLLTPMNEVFLQYRDKENDTLAFMRKIEMVDNPILNQLSVQKNTVLLFISELLQSLLQNEPQHSALYDFIQSSVVQFKTQPATPLWSQRFILQLSKYLGCMPFNNYEDEFYFDLELGQFSPKVSTHSLNLKESQLWNIFLNDNYIGFNPGDRIQILKILIQYFQHQIPHFKQPKSLEIIQEVFSD